MGKSERFEVSTVKGNQLLKFIVVRMKLVLALIVALCLMAYVSEAQAQEKCPGCGCGGCFWDFLSRDSCRSIKNWGLCRYRAYYWLCGRTCRTFPWRETLARAPESPLKNVLAEAPSSMRTS